MSIENEISEVITFRLKTCLFREFVDAGYAEELEEQNILEGRDGLKGGFPRAAFFLALYILRDESGRVTRVVPGTMQAIRTIDRLGRINGQEFEIGGTVELDMSMLPHFDDTVSDLSEDEYRFVYAVLNQSAAENFAFLSDEPRASQMRGFK